MPERTQQSISTKLKSADRRELVGLYYKYRKMRNETMSRLIVDKNRIDNLGKDIIGLQLQPFHMRILQFQLKNKHSMHLVYRGAGKSTCGTVLKTIHMIAKDRNIRIALVSKTKSNAKGFLKEIKGHLENNKLLNEVFGKFYDPAVVTKWDDSAIEVVGRTEIHKEPTITCLGIETAIASRHFDVIMIDDLVDDENSRTAHMRARIKDWYYSVLVPTLNPPNSDKPHCGEMHVLGTRYHYADMYGHWIEGSTDGSGGELKDHTQIIPLLNEKGQTPWPERHTPEWAEKMRSQMGLIHFNAQYQNNTEAMKGEVFRYDDCQIIDAKGNDWPKADDLKIFIGVDLAIGQKEKDDFFCAIVIGCRGKVQARAKSDFEVFVLDFIMNRLRFSDQTVAIVDLCKKYNPIACGIESVAYQQAQLDACKAQLPGITFRGIKTQKDKLTRAWNLSPMFENGKVFFKKDTQNKLIDQLVLFPNHAHDDVFDALEFAVSTAKTPKRRKVRNSEPGVL
jgi:predicted phage terminase large subunit-like protein